MINDVFKVIGEFSEVPKTNFIIKMHEAVATLILSLGKVFP